MYPGACLDRGARRFLYVFRPRRITPRSAQKLTLACGGSCRTNSGTLGVLCSGARARAVELSGNYRRIIGELSENYFSSKSLTGPGGGFWMRGGVLPRPAVPGVPRALPRRGNSHEFRKTEKQKHFLKVFNLNMRAERDMAVVVVGLKPGSSANQTLVNEINYPLRYPCDRCRWSWVIQNKGAMFAALNDIHQMCYVPRVETVLINSCAVFARARTTTSAVMHL